MDMQRIAYLRAELEAERISYGELAEIESAFEEIDPATLPEPAENASASDMLNELESANTSAAIAFFVEHAGWGWNPETETPEEGRRRTAGRLAEAEAYAKANGWTVEWEDDWGVGSHIAEYDCYDSEPSTCEVATLCDAEGECLASLGCIDEATDDYRRVVAAELALEAMPAQVQLTLF